MSFTLRSAAVAAFGAAAVAALPMTVATIATPAVSQAESCPDGQVFDDKTSQCLDVLTAIGRQLPEAPPDMAAQLTNMGAQIPSLSVPNVSIPNISVPSIGIPGVGLPLPPLGMPSLPEPPKPPPLLCGPEINTPIPFVGFKPCL
jgi:hypothetical protein